MAAKPCSRLAQVVLLAMQASYVLGLCLFRKE